MGATEFICPSGNKIPIGLCLENCIGSERCMFLPTLRAVAKSLDRKIDEPTVTELLCGTREQTEKTEFSDLCIMEKIYFFRITIFKFKNRLSTSIP